jgi:uncharacterized protein (TIGR03437 family)
MRFSLISKAALYTSLAAIAISPAKAQTKPQITSIVNGASYQQQVSEGSLATIFGSNFATAPCGATTLPFPQTLCDVSVDADGQRLPVIFANQNQVNFQLPYGPGARNIKVIKNDVESNKVPVDVLARAPGIFMYSTATPEGKVQFRNLASALLGDYSLHGATNPVNLGTFNLHSSIALYLNGMGTPVDGVAPALGNPAPVPLDGSQLLHVRDVDVYINGAKVPQESKVFNGYAPGLIIHQLNIVPPSGTPSGANTVRVCTQDATPVCSQDVTVFMSNTNDYVVGNLSDPGLMSDKKARSLDNVAGTAKSDAGTNAVRVSNGNYLAPAKGTVELAFGGNSDWESYKDTVTTTGGATVVPPVPAFPHVTYTDVKGDYNRNTREWTNVSYIDPVFKDWRGAAGGGEVKLFDLVQYLATNGTNPDCAEELHMWERKDEPIKIYLDATGEPTYDPVTGGICPTYCSGLDPAKAVRGTDILLQELNASPGRGGPTFERIDHDPLKADEHGITVKFSDDLPAGWGGASGILPYGRDSRACGPITSVETSILVRAGSIPSVAAIGRHEILGRGAGYGTSMTGILSPFYSDNAKGYVNDSARDLDGRKLVEFLGYGVDLVKYGK